MLKTARPGTILKIDTEGVVVAAGNGAIRLMRVKPEGEPAMSAFDFSNIYNLKIGYNIGEGN